jgi:hypothetical protein
MSLQVWLPLNGDLNNQGLSNITGSQLGTITWPAGKIGKALCAGNGSQVENGISYNSNLISTLGAEFSAAVWVCPKGNHVHYNGTFISSGNWNTQCWSFGVNQSNTQVDVFGAGYNHYIDCSVPINTWTHLVCVHKNGVTKLYKNGTYIGERSGESDGLISDASNFCVGRETYAGGYFSFNGLINDFRIYNHALSAKEVKEISKGLVLHFPMRDEYIENTTNISSQTNKGGWNNSGAAVRETNNADLIKTAPYPDNVYSIKVTTAGNCALTFGTTTINVPSKTLTCSVYCYLSGTQENNSVYIRSTKTDGSLGSFEYNGTTDTTQWPKDRWIRLEKTITLASTETTIYFCTYANSLNNIRAFSGWQIEEKDHATPFTKDSRNDSTIYDCSGYSHNGQKGGTIICSSNTPKNEACYYFNGTTVDNSSNTLTGASYLTAKISLPASSAMTVSWWGKIVKYGRGGVFETTAYEWDPTNGTDYNTTAFANWDSTFSVCNGTSRVNLYSDLVKVDSKWYLHTITYDGSNVKYYRNGTLISTNALAGTLPAITAIKIGIGRAGGVYRQIQQYVSDFRMYVTTLSAEDVKELYQIPISIDKNGDIFSLSYSENGTKHSFYKTGNVEGALWEKDEPFSLMKNNIPFRENLFKNSNSFGLTGSDFPSVSTRTVGKVVVSSDSIGNAYAWIQGSIEGGMTSIFNSTKTMTLSIDIKVENVTNANAYGVIAIDYRNSGHGALIETSRQLIMDGKWHRYILPITANNGGQTQSLLCLANFQNLNGATIYYKNIKYEEGATGSPWCPSKSEGFTSNMATMVAPISANQFYEV